MKIFAAVVAFAAAAPAFAGGNTVFQCTWDNGFFTPFNNTTPSSIRYGDSGWFGGGADPVTPLCELTLGLVVFNSTAVGSTDLTVTFNNGDPSGMVFGPGTTMYSTTLTGITLPNASLTGGLAAFSLTIPLPGVSAQGGFNNFGWSIGVQNFTSDGSFGFQCSSALAQPVGFYTVNAPYYNGAAWSLFSFGGDPVYGVANFVSTLTVPAPAGAGVLGMGLLALARRRRR